MRRTFYVATRFRNRELALSTATNLEKKFGLACTARWLVRDESGVSKEQCASEDFEDTKRAATVVIFTEGCEAVPGGMWVEMGYAMALKKDVIVVGPKHNIFCGLAICVDDVTELESVI